MKMNNNYYNKKRLDLNNIIYRDINKFQFAYEPLAWLIGQFLSFIMRKNQKHQDMIDDIQANISLLRPCVRFVKIIFMF